MKRKICLCAGIVAAILLLWWFWVKQVAPTRIVLFNFPDFQVAKMVRSADRFVKVKPVSVQDVKDLKKYDAVLVFGMGLRIDEDGRTQLQSLAQSGKPVYSYAVTSPENKVCNLDSLQEATLEAYLNHGGRANFRSLFNHIRRELCGRRLFAGSVDSVKIMPNDCLFHIGDEVNFATVEDYETYLKERGLFKENQAKIALLTGIAGPFNTNSEHLDSIIAAFQNRGYRVYPIAGFGKRMDFLQQIDPQAVIYLPHGRLLMGQGDRAVAWLQQRNIPVFCPLTMNASYDAWMADKQGMMGGFLSQSLVMPELDGGILPYALIAQYQDKDGLLLFKTIPERLRVFCRTVDAYLSLKTKKNHDKKIAVYYFAGFTPGSLSAAGLEVAPSLYHLLRRLQKEGYDVRNLPSNVKDFEKLLNAPASQQVRAEDLKQWLKDELTAESHRALKEKYGTPDETSVACTRFGKVVLLPQPVQGSKGNSFKAVHGENPIPPYPYLASYFWVRHGFAADAMIHFGTHGSLEFIPGKQVALSSNDWTDVLSSGIPHFYLYTIADVGEAMIAKRRSYAVTISHLNPPFMESGLGGEVKKLQDLIGSYLAQAENEGDLPQSNLRIKRMAVEMGLHRDLGLDSHLSQTYTLAQIQQIEQFANELVQEKISAGLYTLGVPFTEEKTVNSVRLIAKDPVAYALAEADIVKGRIKREAIANSSFFARTYLARAEVAINRILKNPNTDLRAIMRSWGITEQDEDNKTVRALRTALEKVNEHRRALAWCSEKEMQSLLNGLAGGYVAPTSGGDFIANPATLPTGRNFYAINAEATPSAAAWEKGKKLAQELLKNHAAKHQGRLPKKVSFTLWSGSFIESEGVTLAQIFHLLGVKPVRDRFGRVLDIKLIPEESLNRPRIDVVVQTSGQFRDLAASRLELLQRAVQMAAEASDKGENFVAQGKADMEKTLLAKGCKKKEAQQLSTVRIFGGLNGAIGTGITAMVQAGDRWEKDAQIAQTYLHNMGAMYSSSQTWGDFKEGLFEAALQNTEVVVQPRQSNTWGALSLDHVYEFMGGLNLSVRHVTGNDPDTYFNDLRNHYQVRLQDLRAAIGVEARTTLFNPNYLKEQLKGGASSAAGLVELVRNTYGWNVMKPSVIGQQMWNRIYDVYVKDVHHLGMREFFERENPAAWQEMTSVMKEAAHKGYWKASSEQLNELAKTQVAPPAEKDKSVVLEKEHNIIKENMNILSNLMFWIANVLLIPVIIGLMYFFLKSLFLLGGFAIKYMQRGLMEKEVRKVFAHLDEQNVGELSFSAALKKNPFVTCVRQISGRPYNEAFVNKAVSEYELAASKEMDRAKTLVKFGPILGLMGTLIPMGPALAGLSSGDITSMAYNMQVAFATTVLGLFVGAVGFVLYQTKQRQTQKDLVRLDFVSQLMKQR